MNKITLLLMVLGLAIFQTQAQTDPPLPPPATTEAGRLIIQFWQGIKATSFTDQWQLKVKTWAELAAKTPNGSILAKNALTLSTYIKPEMFKSTFNLNKFNKAANSAKTYADAYLALKSLEDGLKRDAVFPRWTNQLGNWLHALSVLK